MNLASEHCGRSVERKISRLSLLGMIEVRTKCLFLTLWVMASDSISVDGGVSGIEGWTHHGGLCKCMKVLTDKHDGAVDRKAGLLESGGFLLCECSCQRDNSGSHHHHFPLHSDFQTWFLEPRSTCVSSIGIF